ncbi:MAG: 16S rRNA (guanine(966)-N(2))-methyltransferase RsmD, partial [Bacteroidetes bacterium]|nr:16S rRNA (guanine(966)-N(2))-methyltransferase RsmD [Bacteroidota bacterium]
MRITGGKLKGQLLKGGFASHVRPTTDFVREALMNYLSSHYEIPGADVLDLFSGSGIIALEFLSRGAGSVVSLDIDTKNIWYQQEIQ